MCCCKDLIPVGPGPRLVEVAAFSLDDSSLLWTWAGPDASQTANTSQYFHPGGRCSRQPSRRMYYIDEATGQTLTSAVNDFTSPVTEGSYLGIDINGNGISFGDQSGPTDPTDLWVYDGDGGATTSAMYKVNSPWDSYITGSLGWPYSLTASGHVLQVASLASSFQHRFVDYTTGVAANISLGGERPPMTFDTLQGHYQSLMDYCSDYSVVLQSGSGNAQYGLVWADLTTEDLIVRNPSGRFGVSYHALAISGGYFWSLLGTGNVLLKVMPTRSGGINPYIGWYATLNNVAFGSLGRLSPALNGDMFAYGTSAIVRVPATQSVTESGPLAPVGLSPTVMFYVTAAQVASAAFTSPSSSVFTAVEGIPGTDDFMVVVDCVVSSKNRSVVARVNGTSGTIDHSRGYRRFPDALQTGRKYLPAIWDGKLILQQMRGTVYTNTNDALPGYNYA